MSDSPSPDKSTLLAQLESATLAVARILGVAAISRIGYGTPAYTAFGLGKAQVRHHAHRQLLSLSGRELLIAQDRGQLSLEVGRTSEQQNP